VVEALSGNWGILLILLLRLISIVIPILPGTYCLLISGYLFGLVNGLLISFVADLLSCSISFSLSKRFGRKILKRVMSKKYLNKFENLSKKYLEKNFFLLTGFLMTGWFDFVSYGVGLTKLRWRKFLLALIVSVLLSDLPFVATGNGFRKLQNQNFNIKKILDGNVPSLQKEYLIIFIISVILIFSVGIIGTFIDRKYMKSFPESENDF
jgi:uncharacterized membrane protein YdjX (TVP38/TMEM64 family)|tara:strand:+ start:304 stop:930 length:627 start_codon:yes stop_codon:yes gene_type:complete